MCGIEGELYYCVFGCDFDVCVMCVGDCFGCFLVELLDVFGRIGVYDCVIVGWVVY